MPDVLRLPYVYGSPITELRAVEDGGALRIERRWTPADTATPTQWQPLTIQSLESLMASGGPVASWLERVGVPQTAWIGKFPSELAQFSRE